MVAGSAYGKALAKILIDDSSDVGMYLVQMFFRKYVFTILGGEYDVYIYFIQRLWHSIRFCPFRA